MSGLNGVAWTLAITMLGITLYCVGRLVFARLRDRRTERDVDISHAIMGVAMAGTLVSRFHFLPAGAWALVFGVMAVWFGWRIAAGLRSDDRVMSGHHVPHLLTAGAMLFMLLDGHTGSSGGMGGMASSAVELPTLALVLAVVLFGSAIWMLDRLPVAVTVGGSGGGPLLAPRLASGCQIAMSVTMGYMLIMML